MKACLLTPCSLFILANHCGQWNWGKCHVVWASIPWLPARSGILLWSLAIVFSLCFWHLFVLGSPEVSSRPVLVLLCENPVLRLKLQGLHQSRGSLQIVVPFFKSWRTLYCGMWDLVPWPGVKPSLPALEAQNLNYRTTGEVPLQMLAHILGVQCPWGSGGHPCLPCKPPETSDLHGGGVPFLICKIPVGLGGTPDCSASALNASLRLHCLLVQTEE